MKEILFRGKTTSGEWVYGHYVHQYGADMIYLPNGTDVECGFDYYHIVKETVGQFTDLTDKNGKKIFEGDIVKEKDCAHNDKIQIKGKIFTVEYKDGVFIMAYPERLFKSYLYLMANDIEVIGNIHDNPELLGVKE